MQWKRKICFIFIISIILMGCGNLQNEVTSEEVSSKDDTVTVWAWDENFNIIAVERAIELYKEKHPAAKIEVITMSQEETIAKINSAFVSGSDEVLPDIVLIEDYRIQYYLKHYRHKFEDLSDIVAREDFASYKMGVNQSLGKVFGVPFDSGVVGLFYRLDYIEEAGFTEKDMQNLTWDEYILIGKTVKRKTGRDMLTLNPTDLPLVRMMMQSCGKWYNDWSGEIHFDNNDALKEAIKEYVDIVEAGIAKPVSDWDQFIRAFQEGEVVSVVSGAWISPSIVESEDQSGKWRVAEFPRMSRHKNSINASSVGGSGWYVMKDAANTEEAKKFLAETFASNTELMDILAKEIELVSTLKSAEECPAYKEGVEFYGGQHVFEDFMKWTYEIPAVNYGEYTYDMEQYVAEVVQRVLAGERIDVVLADYQNVI